MRSLADLFSRIIPPPERRWSSNWYTLLEVPPSHVNGVSVRPCTDLRRACGCSSQPMWPDECGTAINGSVLWPLQAKVLALEGHVLALQRQLEQMELERAHNKCGAHAGYARTMFSPARCVSLTAAAQV